MIFSRYLPWLLTLVGAVLCWFVMPALSVIFLALFLLGIRDVMQTHHAILRNYPVTGHIRFMLEYIRQKFDNIFLKAMKKNYPFHVINVAWRIQEQNDKMIKKVLVRLFLCMRKIVSG